MGWLDHCPARFRAALLRCARGDAPANVAVMQLHAQAAADSEVATVLAAAIAACRADRATSADDVARLAAALAVARDHPQAFATVKAVLGGLDHGGAAATPEDGVAHWAAVFDGAVQRSAEGSVALYALGDPALLQEATDEVVGMLRRDGLLGAGRDVLDIGCGIGRFETALAAEVRSVVGIDISPRMIAMARQRCAGSPNVAFLLCSGRDLAPFATASFDLVLAVDAFPYLVQSGIALAETHVREAARVLRPGGRLLILNFSYRGDDALDRSDVARLAARSGLELVRAGTRELRVWDALAFDLVRNRREIAAAPEAAGRPGSRGQTRIVTSRRGLSRAFVPVRQVRTGRLAPPTTRPGDPVDWKRADTSGERSKSRRDRLARCRSALLRSPSAGRVEWTPSQRFRTPDVHCSQHCWLRARFPRPSRQPRRRRSR